MSNIDQIFVLLAAGSIFLLMFGVYKTWLEKRFLAKEYIETELLTQPTAAKIDNLPFTERQISILKERQSDNRQMFRNIQDQLDNANMMLKSTEFVALSLALAAISILITVLLSGNFFLSLIVGVAMFFLPQFYLKVRIMLRMKKAHDEFPDVLDMIVSCFKTGYGFTRSCQVVTENFRDPWGTEFGRMVVEMNFGAQQSDILKGLHKRVPLPEVDLFTSAITIQQETGGNMIEILKNLSSSIRSHHKIKRKIQSLSAQGKISALIVSLVPFLIFFIMLIFVGKPVVEFLQHPIGLILTLLALVWTCIGIYVLSRIVQIDI